MPVQEAVAMIFVTIAVLVTISGIIGSILSHRRKMAEIKYGRADREAALVGQNNDLRETVGLMQDRIAVLEQIAIDPARRTAEEIERLR